MLTQVRLKLEAIRLGSVLFRPNALEVEKWDDLPSDISVKVFQLESRKEVKKEIEVVTVIEMKVGDLEKEKSEYPFDLLVNYAGFFSIKPEALSEKDLKRVAGINCAAIVFPFLRQEIAELTMKAFGKPLLLPPVNFVALFKEKGVEIRKIPKEEETDSLSLTGSNGK